MLGAQYLLGCALVGTSACTARDKVAAFVLPRYAFTTVLPRCHTRWRHAMPCRSRSKGSTEDKVAFIVDWLSSEATSWGGNLQSAFANLTDSVSHLFLKDEGGVHTHEALSMHQGVTEPVHRSYSFSGLNPYVAKAASVVESVDNQALEDGPATSEEDEFWLAEDMEAGVEGETKPSRATDDKASVDLSLAAEQPVNTSLSSMPLVEAPSALQAAPAEVEPKQPSISFSQKVSHLLVKPLWLGGRLVASLVAVTYAILSVLSSSLRLVRPGRPQQRVALTQRLTTSWTHWLHSHARWLLNHPVFYGRKFPWQWQATGNTRAKPTELPSAVAAFRISASLTSLLSMVRGVLGRTVSFRRARDELSPMPPWPSSIVKGLFEDESPRSVLRVSREWAEKRTLFVEVPSIAAAEDDHASQALSTAHIEPPANTTGSSLSFRATPPSLSPAEAVVKDSQPINAGVAPEGVNIFAAFFPRKPEVASTPEAVAINETASMAATSTAPAGVVGHSASLAQPAAVAGSVTAPQAVATASMSAAGGDGAVIVKTRRLTRAERRAERRVKIARATAAREARENDEEVEDDALPEESAYGRLLADLNTKPMQVTEEEPQEFDPDLGFDLPMIASAVGLENLDKNMVILATRSASLVQTKLQLTRFVQEIGISPLLSALKKSIKEQHEQGEHTHEAARLRADAAEALLHLMNVAMDLKAIRAAMEGNLDVSHEMVTSLIDVIEEPLLLTVPRVFRPRDDEVLHRGQRAAVEILFQLVLASDRAIQLIQEDGRLWNALMQISSLYKSEDKAFRTANKLLAAIGYNEWKPRQPGQKGIRVLCFDGGGTKGVLSIALLKAVMERLEKNVHEVFDVICGTSTGGILAVLLGVKKKSIADTEALYDGLVSKIFSSNPIMQAPKLLLRQAYYDEGVWEALLLELLGDSLMIDSMAEGPSAPKIFCTSLSLKTKPPSLWLWRNYEYSPDAVKKRYGGSFRVMVRDALRATTAAPTYFSPLPVEGYKYCDGAFLANNPTMVALNEVKTLFPGVPVEVVVSIGTGYTKEDRKADVYGWDGIVNDLVDCATSTELVHEYLTTFMPRSRYFRFNPRTDFIPLDEVRPERLASMKKVARDFLAEPEQRERLNQLVSILKKGSNPLTGMRSGQ